MQPFKDAVGICKTIMRNGYEAYVINTRMQQMILETDQEAELDIATELDFDGLARLFLEVVDPEEPGVVAMLREGGSIFRFYPADTTDTSHPDETLSQMTPRILKRLEERGELPMHLANPFIPSCCPRDEGFLEMESGEICFAGIPDQTLRSEYLLGIRALRFAANSHKPLEPNTHMAITRSAQAILDYVSVADIVDEWRKVMVGSMAEFVRLLFDTQILHGLIPEVAALSRVRQIKHDDEEETVLAHTLDVMRCYAEEKRFDWYGVMACLFHDVGKLYTADWADGKWTFHYHHRVGAKIARKILNRLQFEPKHVDLVTHLVRHHKRFDVMLTDKGIRRFMALDEYPRIMEMAKANIEARGAAYTEFNHNKKMMERAETPEEMLEPLLNGNEIMEFTSLKPGPAIGLIRAALLQSQIAGDVSSVPEAVDFVMEYIRREHLG